MESVGKRADLFDFVTMRMKATQKERRRLKQFFETVDPDKMIERNKIGKIKFKAVYIFYLLTRASKDMARSVLSHAKDEWSFEKLSKQGMKKAMVGQTENQTLIRKKKNSVIHPLVYTVDTSKIPSIKSDPIGLAENYKYLLKKSRHFVELVGE